MPRLKAVDPATDTGPGADFLNGPLKAKQINIFKGIAANPGVLEAFVGFAGGVKAGALTPAEHEVVALACAQKRNCEYCLAAHTAIGAGVGIGEEDALKIRRLEHHDPKTNALATFTTQIVESNGFVTDDQLATFKDAGYDDDAVVETIGAIAVNTFTNFFNHVHETEVDFPVPAAV